MILVTGATGFVGRHVVRCLLAAGQPVVALARGRDGVTGAERVAGAVGFTPDGALLDVVEGDLATREGVAGAELGRLRERVETVIHCAGDTSFFPQAMTAFVAGHVDGPVALLRGLAGGRLSRWTQLSTAYVCGRRSGVVLEGEGDVGQTFHNPYERVKLDAERALRAAAARSGVEITVLRPSIVVGAAPGTAGGAPANLFFGFIRLVAALRGLGNGGGLRIVARPRARFNIVPVDYVAAAVAALAEDPRAAGETGHLVVRDAPTQETMLAMLSERLGLRGLSLVDASAGQLRDPSPLEIGVARMLSPYRDYLRQDLVFDDATACRLLRRSGVTRPALAAGEVEALVDRALSTAAARAPWLAGARA